MQFVGEPLLQLLGSNNFPDGLKVKRAHHIGPQSLPLWHCAMTTQIYHFPGRRQFSDLHSPVSFSGAQISIFPDFSLVSEQRCAFDRAKKLRGAGIKHSLLFLVQWIFLFRYEQNTGLLHLPPPHSQPGPRNLTVNHLAVIFISARLLFSCFFEELRFA